MKFLSKKTNSNISSQGLTYQDNRSANNKKLLNELISEQKNFCAYTEKYLKPLDSPEVEHFNSKIKYQDDYYNYYAVLRAANLYKQDEKYPNASFFKNLFFQSEDELKKRIVYSDGIYQEVNPQDIEAKEFIDFLGLNDNRLYTERARHVHRIKHLVSNYSKEEILDFLKRYKEELSFITALEVELNIDLTQLI
ncbi:MAG: hypothetical protein KBF93_07535 [Leptospiraceae bacterium]|jgi:hypothetical protein|nr:hypothetical protein [Leptospiraceae bacterium]